MQKIPEMKIRWLAVLLTIATTRLQAGLLGESVNLSAHYPDASSVWQAGPIVVVSAGVEYAAGSFPSYSSSWQIDITDTQIRITDIGGLGFPYGAAPFNGWVLKTLTGPGILSATPAGDSQFNPIAISIVNGNELFLNYSEVAGPQFGTSTIDITLVPEPACLAVVGLALCGLVTKKRAAA